MEYGSLYLIPNYLGINSNFNFNNHSLKIIDKINHFVFENEKPGRAFIKIISPNKCQTELIINTLNKFTSKESISSFLNPCFKGYNIGLVSDAGCPGIADPGAELIYNAHLLNLKVIPLVGPSSILLALMASGLNGQNFKFNGYLPIEKIDRKNKIKFLEKQSYDTTQIFMETPYRNRKLIIDLLKFLKPTTKLCIATDLTLNSELVKTQTIKQWKNNLENYDKRPSIFLIQSN